MKKLNSIFAFLILIIAVACDSGPRVIEAQPTDGNNTAKAGITATDIPAFKNIETHSSSPSPFPSASPTTGNQREVVVDEVLDTERYSYLNVTEGDEKFWIAISKREVTVGDTYLFKGGLLKKNFYSQEYDRTFETVYLVSNIAKKGQPAATAAEPSSSPHQNHNHEVDMNADDVKPAEGTVLLSDLLSNKEKYGNQTIKITGKVVKVNPMIMQRNWLHLQDSSGKEYDLTVTTTENVPLGAVVTMEGTITLDKDFGAGYRYDIIMEGATLK